MRETLLTGARADGNGHGDGGAPAKYPEALATAPVPDDCIPELAIVKVGKNESK